MKQILKKIANILELVFGYGVMLSLFLGGITFFGYAAALMIGGDVAQRICHFIYKEFFPQLIYYSSVLVLIGLVKMYICGETALKAEKKNP